MTAEVAVLNKFGVALAADSAITVEQFHDQEIKRKVYNSANKLFTLSKFEPIGIMFYNAVTLGGVPWETIIKVYRKQLHDKKFDHLSDYATDFFQWLKDPNNHVFADSQVARILWRNLARRIMDLPRKRGKRAQFLQRLNASITEMQKLQDVDGFDANFAKQIQRRYQTEIRAAYELLPKALVKGQRRKLTEYCTLLLTKRKSLPGYAGIVVCGFGDRDLLPRLKEFRVDIVVNDRVRFWEVGSHEISEKNPSAVVPLADAGVIETLMQGISPDFKDAVFDGALELIVTMPQKILEPVAELNDVSRQLA